MPTYFTHLKTREAAALLNLSQRALERWRTIGYGPPYSRFGRAIRYPRTELELWIAARRSDAPRRGWR